MTNDSKPVPLFRPFVETCREHGISRTVAYELANDGLLDTFTIGRARYVMVESLHSLPERLARAKARNAD